MEAVQELQSLTAEQQRRMNRLKESRVVAEGYKHHLDLASAIYVYLISPTRDVYPKEGKLFLPQPYKVLQLPIKGQVYFTDFDNITSTYASDLNPKEDSTTDGFNLVGKSQIIEDIRKHKEIRYNNSLAVVFANRVFKELKV